jgi:hypothetical protein
VAHITPVIAVLDAMARTCADLSSARYLMIARERDAARTTLAFAAVHDRAARGDLVGQDYDDALAALRERVRGTC